MIYNQLVIGVLSPLKNINGVDFMIYKQLVIGVLSPLKNINGFISWYITN